MSFIFGLLLSASLSWASQCQVMMSMLNAENLFKDQRVISTDELLQKKIDNVAAGIASINKGDGPDFLGIAEIGPDVINALVKSDKLKSLGYKSFATSGKPDGRGIDVGFISKFPMIGDPIVHEYWNDDPIWQSKQKRLSVVEPKDDDKDKDDGIPEIDKDRDENQITRTILEVKVQMPNGEAATVFVNHWPSRLSGDLATIRRYLAARALNKRVGELLKADPKANIVVMGDFNTNPWGAEMQVGLEAIEAYDPKSMKTDGPALFNLDGTMFDYTEDLKEYKREHPGATSQELQEFKAAQSARHGTHYYDRKNQWSTFDQIIVSSNMLSYYVDKSFTPVNKAPFSDKQGHPNRFDPKTGKGISDHFPVVAAFVMSDDDKDKDAPKKKASGEN